jgi:release factor glutamine methyltransferase
MMNTLNDLYIELRKKLKQAGIEQPEFEAREIVRVLVGKDKNSLMREIHQYVGDRTADNAFAQADKRIAGVPLAYVLGQWDFFGVTLEVNPDVLIPRSDTEILAGAAIAYLRDSAPDGRLLDLCCGSGCVGLAAVSRLPRLSIILADNSPRALEVARRNASGFHGVITIAEVDALLPPPPTLGEFDVIASNPPYVTDAEYESLDKSVKEHEPAGALRGGPDGLTYIRAIVENWHDALKPGGYLMLETGHTQAEQTARLLEERGFTEVVIHKDLRDLNRVVVGRRALPPPPVEDEPEETPEEITEAAPEEEPAEQAPEEPAENAGGDSNG